MIGPGRRRRRNGNRQAGKDDVSRMVRRGGLRVETMSNKAQRGERFRAVLRDFVTWEKRRVGLRTPELRGPLGPVDHIHRVEKDGDESDGAHDMNEWHGRTKVTLGNSRPAKWLGYVGRGSATAGVSRNRFVRQGTIEPEACVCVRAPLECLRSLHAKVRAAQKSELDKGLRPAPPVCSAWAFANARTTATKGSN